MNKIAEQIQRIRKQRGLSQIQLGDLLGVSQQVVTNYERGLREPNIEMMLKIAEIFDVSIEVLIGEKPIPQSDSTPRAVLKRIEVVKKLPPEKQKAFMLFVDALNSDEKEKS